MKKLLVISVLSVICFSCSLRVISPEKKTYTLADSVYFNVIDTKHKIDSMYVTMGGKLIPGNFAMDEYAVFAGNLLPGNNKLLVNFRMKNGKELIRRKDVFVVSDITPEKILCREVGELPHDTSAFTQGFVYHKGLLYESTGLKGRSRLRILNPYDGTCLKDKKTDPELFNEGIAVIRDTLYQLTWKDSVMLVYDMDFNELYRRPLPVEGWGMCSKNDTLFISNGTNEIISMYPDSGNFIDTIRVVDNKGPVIYINEMEWVKGMLWANVYGKDEIYVIDPETGKVAAVILTHDLIDRKKYFKAGVMNGIAYDPYFDKVYLTGKNWPFIKVCIPHFGE